MWQLIIKIIVFVILIMSVISPIALINKIAIERRMKSNIFLLSPNINTLISGDSHTQVALDPDIIPGSINISGSGESLFYTYYKLKYILNRNHGVVRNVVLGFSYHNLSKRYQDEYLFNDIEFAYSMESYYHFLDYPAKIKLIHSNNITVFLLYCLKYDCGIPLMEYKELDAIKLLFRSNIEKSDIAGLGGFSTTDESDLDNKKIINKIRRYYLGDEAGYAGYSQNMIDILDDIASLCAENNIRLYLYNAPLNVAYRRLVPIEAYANYDDVVKSLKSRYPNVTLIDMSTEPLDDSHFKDGDHLNKIGANAASRMLPVYMLGTDNH